jgi:hypothetical protein
MEPGVRVLGPASARWNDYLGTVAADSVEGLGVRPSLYELAQVDRSRYTIVGIELKVDGPTTATVYAIDRVAHAIERQDQIAELGRGQGEIPVVPFEIPGANAGYLMRHAFRRISVRLVAQDLRDQILVVSEPSSAEDFDA